MKYLKIEYANTIYTSPLTGKDMIAYTIPKSEFNIWSKIYDIFTDIDTETQKTLQEQINSLTTELNKLKINHTYLIESFKKVSAENHQLKKQQGVSDDFIKTYVNKVVKLNDINRKLNRYILECKNRNITIGPNVEPVYIKYNK